MSSTNPVGAIALNRFFAPLGELAGVSSKLLRLIQLSDALPVSLSQRPHKTKRLIELCSKVHEMAATNLVEAQQAMLQGVRDMRLGVYVPLFSKPETSGSEFQAKVNQVIKDVKSVQIPPAKKSFRGNKGPTLLVQYPSFDESGNIKNLKSCVIKWTNWTEILSHRVYGLFSSMLQNSAFVVPKSTALDFEGQIHERVDGSRIQMDPDLSVKLQDIFTKIKKQTAPSTELTDKEIVIYERVKGENLFDFAQVKYQHLSPEKKETFFTKLGAIALLDVILGNMDRFVQVFTDSDGEYSLQDLEANLGNAMVEWDVNGTAGPIVYAIDNGVGDELMSDPEKKEKYLVFLEKLFGSDDPYDKLATNMLETLKHAVQTQVDDAEGNVSEIRDHLAVFTRDLDSIALGALKKGFMEMAEELKSSVFPKWVGEENSPGKEYLLNFFPEILSDIEKRINLFCSTSKRNGVCI